MMEFFLSKVWLFVCGIAVTAVLVMAFTGLDHNVSDSESQRRVDQLADVIDSAADFPDVHLAVEISDYLPDADSAMRISNGYVSLVHGNVLRHAALHREMEIFDGLGFMVENCTLAHGDRLMLSNDRSNKVLHVQVAKERTVSLTA